MCGVPENTKSASSPPGFGMDAEFKKRKSFEQCSVLLELSAFNDLVAFKKVVEEEGISAHEPSCWYGRFIGSRKMGFQQRTPLMIAALYGSTDVLKFILSMDGVDVKKTCGSDGAAALHCAAAGGSKNSVEIVKLLLEASADLNCVDSNGNRPGDVIPRSLGGTKVKSLENMIKGEDAGNFSEESAASGSESPRVEQASGEKKEYPIDLSLPDIKTGIYGTDEFRMYTFKVKPCSRAYSHDWTECPFVHPGENARRRDPRKYHYSCVPCPEFRKGTCRQGDACEYAHGVFECWLHPAQYRTRLCKDETSCTRRVCFFAHKPEELRPLYPSTGSAVPSPRSSTVALDMASLSPLALGGSSMLMIPTSTPPMSPSTGSSLGGPTWSNQSMVPSNLQLPGSRLKSALSARDMELDMDLVGLEGLHQQQLIDEIANLSMQSNRPSSLANALAASAGSRSGKFSRVGSVTPSNLDEFFGSVDPSTVTQLQGHSLKSTGSQFQSPNMTHSYAGNLPSSPARTPSPFGLDPSVATAVMNSKSAAFAKRSQSFCDRSGVNRFNGLATSAMATTPTTSSMMSDWGSPSPTTIYSDWGSPSGKLDWGVQGEELHKLRKSASVAIRSVNGSSGMAAVDEPDVSWVQSLVKEATPTSQGWLGVDNYNSSGTSEMLSPWAEQMYMEQEQMVA
ncbi:zinc finger CCCH domain-containing protein 66-like [Aristolochia californica]|uniref:zinc finger CCCH domain-containing protein 66-like n=1 Tax=Aristolochia californica TaxID=171875 RepID=UPI0035DBE79A